MRLIVHQIDMRISSDYLGSIKGLAETTRSVQAMNAVRTQHCVPKTAVLCEKASKTNAPLPLFLFELCTIRVLF